VHEDRRRCSSPQRMVLTGPPSSAVCGLSSWRALADESSWGPVKAVAAELAKRDVDLTDREAVDEVIRQLNAKQVPRRLIQE
jgi:hypothetical protein